MAGLIPRPFIDDLLHRTDLVELIDSFIPLKKRGNSHLACCPFHNEKTPSFNVVPKKQFYHCFGCGASGNAISFIMNYLNQSFTEAVETLASRVGLTVPREGQNEKNQPGKDLYQLLNQVNKFYQNLLKTQGQQAIAYLKNRGSSGEIAKLYQLGYAPQGWNTLGQQFKKQTKELITTGMLIQKEDGSSYDRYRQRVMFPIHDRHGRIIGFGGRTLDDTQKPKYLNSPETVLFQKSRELYGLHQVLSHKNPLDYILVVEGYMDVIALAQHGIFNAVATLGTATSIFHIQLLAKFTKRIVFCFDGDNAGRQAAWRALESSLSHVNNGLDAQFVFLPEAHDPDSLIREEGREKFINRLQQALPLHRLMFDTLAKDLPLSTPAGKTQLINVAKPLINKMTEGSYKEFLVDDLARLTHLESHRLAQLLNEKESSSLTDSLKNNKITRTPLRVAIALLLQHPDIYSQCQQHIKLTHLDKEEHGILIQLLEHLNQNLQTNTASIIELWRDTPLFESIIKLASWDHQVPEPELTTELIDTLLFLQRQTHENNIKYYIEKSRQVGLTEEERLNLVDMLKERHQTEKL